MILNIVIDQGVCFAGHEKSILDDINGISKNIAHKVLYRQVQDAMDAGSVDNDSKNLYQFMYLKKGRDVFPLPIAVIEFWRSITVLRRKKDTKRKKEMLKICI